MGLPISIFLNNYTAPLSGGIFKYISAIPTYLTTYPKHSNIFCCYNSSHYFYWHSFYKFRKILVFSFPECFCMSLSQRSQTHLYNHRPLMFFLHSSLKYICKPFLANIVTPQTLETAALLFTLHEIHFLKIYIQFLARPWQSAPLDKSFLAIYLRFSFSSKLVQETSSDFQAQMHSELLCSQKRASACIGDLTPETSKHWSPTVFCWHGTAFPLPIFQASPNVTIRSLEFPGPL